MSDVAPPYSAILNCLQKGQVVPFLGAGSSIGPNNATPTWPEGTSPPSGRALASWLAEQVEFPDTEIKSDLAKVASYYQASVDRLDLMERLREVFNRAYEPRPIHYFLAELPRPQLIVTTNYDDLIERAFQARHRPYHLVVHCTDNKELAASVLWWEPGATEPRAFAPAQLPLSLDDTSIVYKMHGSIDRAQKYDNFVITEEDYVEFLARMTGQSAIPARFMLRFKTSRFLFLGYGLADWNFRVMLKSLRDVAHRVGQGDPSASTDERRSWAIQYKPSDLEARLWAARNVNIYNITIDDFVLKLRQKIAPAGSP